VILPFVAAGALINSVFVLEASALFVEGRQWVVTRSYLWHVIILVVGTAILVPSLGIVGYGWAELVACIPYVILHRGLQPGMRISLGATMPWLAAFVAVLLGSLSTSPMRWLLWLPPAFLVWWEMHHWLVQRSRTQVPDRTQAQSNWVSPNPCQSNATGD